MESLAQKSIDEFIDVLAGKAPVPGGGGAAALAGAVGTALGNMVGSLTVGKKKYAAVEADVQALMRQATALQGELLALMDEDAKAFAPLAAAYGLPAETEAQQAEKQAVMEDALRTASAVPLTIMEKCCEAIALHEQFAEKGSVIAISDVGVGVALCRAALQGASLNVLINTKSMRDHGCAEQKNLQVRAMLDEFVPRADRVYEDVEERFSL